MAEVARALRARVLILGSAPGDLEPWRGVDWHAVGYVSDWLAQSDVVVLPAFVEHQPRALLRALQSGVGRDNDLVRSNDIHDGRW